MTFDEYYADDHYTHVPNVLNPSAETVAHCHSILVLDPYGGCIHQCRFCYVTMGLARIHNQDFNHIIAMRTKLPIKFAGFLKKYHGLKFPVRISSNCDPFQPIEHEMHLTHQLLELCLEYDYPVVLNTKGQIPAPTLELLEELNAKSLLQVQISIVSLDPQVVGVLEPNVPLEQRISLVQVLIGKGIPVTIRFQPIIPEINSSPDAINEILSWCKTEGIQHLIISFLRINHSQLAKLYGEMADEGLISDQIRNELQNPNNWDNDGFYLHPNFQFREKIVVAIHDFCVENDISFSTCKEPFRSYHTIEDCCGGIYSLFSSNWTTDIIACLPKNIQKLFYDYPRV